MLYSTVTLALVVASAVAQSAPTVPAPGVPVPTETRPEDFWEFYGSEETWEDARQICEQDGGSLVSIGSRDENRALVRFVKRENSFFQDVSVWTSGNDLDAEGVFKFADGSEYYTSEDGSLQFTNWERCEPSNSQGNEHCMEVTPDGFWNDQDCDEFLSFVCDFAPVEEPEIQPPEFDNLIFVDDDLDWEQAEDACVEEGGHLVSVQSQEEQDVLRAFLESQDAPVRNVWIGANDWDEEGVFVWTDGSDFTYENFNAGQPDAAGRFSHCVDFDLRDDGWNDQNCFDNIFPFVCEI